MLVSQPPSVSSLTRMYDAALAITAVLTILFLNRQRLASHSNLFVQSLNLSESSNSTTSVIPEKFEFRLSAINKSNVTVRLKILVRLRNLVIFEVLGAKFSAKKKRFFKTAFPARPSGSFY